jgi:hypothetical protein
MYNPDTDLLFPPRVLPALRDLRGMGWQSLVTRVMDSGAESLELMGFVLMMARLNNCGTCNADSYRAMNGCSVCARQSLKRFHESDEVLTKLFEIAKEEVTHYSNNKIHPSG